MSRQPLESQKLSAFSDLLLIVLFLQRALIQRNFECEEIDFVSPMTVATPAQFTTSNKQADCPTPLKTVPSYMGGGNERGHFLLEWFILGLLNMCYSVKHLRPHVQCSHILTCGQRKMKGPLKIVSLPVSVDLSSVDLLPPTVSIL